MNIKHPSRRDFVKTTGAAGAGLIIGFNIPWLQGCAGPPPVPVGGSSTWYTMTTRWARAAPQGF